MTDAANVSQGFKAPPKLGTALALFGAVLMLYGAFVASGAGQALYEWSKTFAPYSVRQYLGISKRYLLQYGHIVFLFALLVLSYPIFRSERSLPTSGKVADFIAKYSAALFLFHFPILFCLAAVTDYDKTNTLHQLALLAATVAASLVLGRVCFATKPLFDRAQARVAAWAETTFPPAKDAHKDDKPLTLTRSHSEFLNQVKILAMICVVIGHFSFDRLTTLHLPGFDGAAPRFAVPLFFMISGYFLMMSIERHKIGPVAIICRRVFSLYYIIVPMLVVTVVLDTFGFRANAALYDFSDYYVVENLRRPYTAFEVTVASASSLLYMNESWLFAWFDVHGKHGGIRAFSNDPFWFMCYLIAFSILLVVIQLMRGAKRVLAVVLWVLIFGVPILLLAPLFFAGVWAYAIHKDWSRCDA